MNAIVSTLLERFDRGMLTRRDLMQGLAMLAAGSGAAAHGQTQESAMKAAKIDHVSIQVSDLARSVAFYENLFGLTVVGEDKANEIVRLGVGKTLVSLHHKNPTAVVDHFAIGIEKFNRDAVTQTLKARGVIAEENLDAGFHIKDPEGISVQIVGA
jgi:catechol 2,3-dioxygenase-like lactoylglutathione lyase family enzyme